MNRIVECFHQVKKDIPPSVRLIVVSKTQAIETILEIYHAQHKIFGENRVQELLPKYEQLPKDIEWHLIGHLQTNKVKSIAPFVALIHSVDSLKLLKEINKEALKNNRVIDCLLQLHIASEETKFGFSFREAEDILESPELQQLKNIRIKGLMGMATFTNDKNRIRSEFRSLSAFFQTMKDKYQFEELSMGMSGDYAIAIEEGSTMVRVGTAIFGKKSQ